MPASATGKVLNIMRETCHAGEGGLGAFGVFLCFPSFPWPIGQSGVWVHSLCPPFPSLFPAVLTVVPRPLNLVQEQSEDSIPVVSICHTSEFGEHGNIRGNHPPPEVGEKWAD